MSPAHLARFRDGNVEANLELVRALHEVADQVVDLVEQLRGIVTDGVAAGEFTADDPAATARAVFEATTGYHHPARAAEWSVPGVEAAFDDVCSLLLDGLRAR